MAILLWRLLTFYFPIIVGLLFYVRRREVTPENEKAAALTLDSK